MPTSITHSLISIFFDMDRPLEKKFWNSRRLLAFGGGVAVIALIAFAYNNSRGGQKLNVQTDRLSVSVLAKGAFQETIPVNGVVLPIKTIYLDALEGGQIEERFVEDGVLLRQGQPIVKLANSDLQLSLSNQETSVFQLYAQLQYSRNQARQTTIQQQNLLAEAENALVEADRVFRMNQKLHDDNVIADQEFRSSQNLYTYQTRRKRLIEQTLRQDSVTNVEQMNQMRETLRRSEESLVLMRKKAGDLVVKAPVSGQLTSLNAEIGQLVSRGTRLGQVDVLDGFKIRADIDEHYISRVFVGLVASFDFADQAYQLKVKKVFSQVQNGRFQVDMEFVGKVPQGIRRGQTMQIRLALSDQTQALLLPKGGFYQQTGGNWIFKLADDGSRAYRVNIQLGRQNPDFYEVLDGLSPGDKVVTSSYDTYGEMQELVLKK